MSPGFKFHYIPNTFDESPKNQKTLSAIAHFAIIYKAKIKEEHHTVPLGGGRL
jgi:hypothetical protein